MPNSEQHNRGETATVQRFSSHFFGKNRKTQFAFCNPPRFQTCGNKTTEKSRLCHFALSKLLTPNPPTNPRQPLASHPAPLILEPETQKRKEKNKGTTPLFSASFCFPNLAPLRCCFFFFTLPKPRHSPAVPTKKNSASHKDENQVAWKNEASHQQKPKRKPVGHRAQISGLLVCWGAGGYKFLLPGLFLQKKGKREKGFGGSWLAVD